MAFNFYQPYQAYQPQQNNGIIWVQGEAGAKSYMVAPNTTAQLWDSESQTIYLKSADASGMPTMRILDYTIRESAQMPQNSVLPQTGIYATREEVDALKSQINELKQEMEKRGKKNESTIQSDEQ